MVFIQSDLHYQYPDVSGYFQMFLDVSRCVQKLLEVSRILAHDTCQ